jgi:hypothetical protein
MLLKSLATGKKKAGGEIQKKKKMPCDYGN